MENNSILLNTTVVLENIELNITQYYIGNYTILLNITEVLSNIEMNIPQYSLYNINITQYYM